MLRVPVVRQIYRTFYRALEIWVDEGFFTIFSRTGHKVGLALRGRNSLVEGCRPPATALSRTNTQQWIAVDGAPPDASGHAGGDRGVPCAAARERAGCWTVETENAAASVRELASRRSKRCSLIRAVGGVRDRFVMPAEAFRQATG